MIKSIVTSNLGFDIAKKKGIHTFETLTGFKFIGERMNEFELARDQEGNNKDFDFLFGYEESYGYLSGTHVRDKDAVVSSFMICEMSAKLKGEGKTLIDRLNEIYAEFGYYYDTQESLVLKGKENLEKITAMMDLLRNSCSPFFETKKVLDYSKPVPAEEDFGYLPVANVLYYEFFDGSWIAVRPSGTEPQIKFYYSIKGNSEEEAMTRQQNLKENLMKMLSVIEKQG